MTDNNGQISQTENTKDIIGKWAIGNKTEVGDGGEYNEICKRQDLTCINTFIPPEMGERGKLATWDSKCGRYSRQIDFFAISSKNKIG